MDRAIILGASRGLGAQLAKHALANTYPVTGFGRKESALQAIRDREPLFEYQVTDFAKPEGQAKVESYLTEQTYNKVFFMAAGGPYGHYHERAWRDHAWAFEVSFLFQAKMLHAMAAKHRFEQVILIGSSVAENHADPMASSYAAAKHALKGLYETLHLEYPQWDLRLFSPGYMDTDMLPKNAAVRQLGVYDPAHVAEELWTWSLTAEAGGHKVLSKHPIQES